MTVTELHERLRDLPDAMPIAIRRLAYGYDGVLETNVRNLAPEREVLADRGLLVEDYVDFAKRRPHLVLTSGRTFYEQLSASNLEGFSDPEDEEWVVFGGADETPRFGVEVDCEDEGRPSTAERLALITGIEPATIAHVAHERLQVLDAILDIFARLGPDLRIMDRLDGDEQSVIESAGSVGARDTTAI